MIAYKSKLIDKNKTISITNSNGQNICSDNLEYLLDFLLEPAPQNEFKVAWDIDRFIAPLLKLIDKDSLQRMFQQGKVFLKPYNIKYNQNKSLFISKGSWRATIYHLKQYYPDDDEPSLQGTVEKGNYLLKEMRAIGITPTRLSSPVAMLDSILDNFDLPTYEHIPDGAGQYSWECCGRNWVEAVKIGWWHQDVFDLDLISAFSNVMATLMDTRYGSWTYSKEPPPNAKYGWCYGQVTIDKDVKISPIIYIDADGHLYSPTGTWSTCLLLQEIDFIHRYGLGRFRITDGHFWTPKQRVYPLQLLMQDLFGKRHKSDLANRVVKRGANGIYGRLLQVFPEGKFGEHFNPVWGSIIETLPRLEVAKFIYENDLVDATLHIATDGFLSDREVKVENSGRMGSWRLDSQGPALIVSSGNLFYGDKHPCQLYYPEAMEMINAKPKASEWSKPIKRTMTLGDMFLDEFAEIGEEREVATGFSLKIDHDRSFERLPSSGKDLLTKVYDSRPLRASKLSKPELKEVEVEKPV